MSEAPRTPHRRAIAIAVVTSVILLGTVVALRLEGRRWWCTCGQPSIWTSEMKSSHGSQHLLDVYSITHFLHGVAFAGLLALVVPRLQRASSGIAVLALESGWEVLENSAFIIDRYRTGTAALGYEGDSIANSLGDIACCLLGWAVARALGWKRSIALFIAIELLLLFWIRDNLTLNIIMLLYPIDAIKQWQLK